MSHQQTEHLNVFLNFNDQRLLVGTLRASARKIWFEYHADFLKTKINISPFQLNFSPGIQFESEGVFEGLFGVFNDSLPDGWGRLLMDRKMRQMDIPPQHLTPLDRLTFVGDRGMGALEYEPFVKDSQQNTALNLDEIAEKSQCLLDGSVDTFFDDLLALNGSSGGARPKIVAQVSNDFTHIKSGQGSSDPKFSNWLIKFPGGSDPNDIGCVEYAYSLMAKAAGIEMPETHLFKTEAGNQYFAIKRFDHQQSFRYHVHTLGGLIGADHRIPALDYEMALKVTHKLTKNIEDIEKHFRLAVFNILAHNRDDHVKNFSYLMDSNGKWIFAPAYDLTYSHGPGGEQSTAVMGEGKNPGISDLKKLGNIFHLKNTNEIIDEVHGAIRKWNQFAEYAGIDKNVIRLPKN